MTDTIWTLTTDVDAAPGDALGVVTTVHLSERDAYRSLRESFAKDFDGDNGALTDHLTEELGVVFYLNEHTLTQPAPPDLIVMLVLDETPLDEGDDPADFPPEDELHLACPHCGNGTFYEVDRAERWNEVALFVDSNEGGTTDRAKLDVTDLSLVTSEGSDGDGFETDHWMCQACYGHVTIPEWLHTEWN